MAKAKKKKQKNSYIDKSPVRKKKARSWIKTYTGIDIVKDYREHFLGVDVICAVRELQEIGYPFEPGYVERVLFAEAARIDQIHRANEKKLNPGASHNDLQDDTFFFIAGYTSGGAPYGTTWEEMGLEPYESIFGDDDE